MCELSYEIRPLLIDAQLLLCSWNSCCAPGRRCLVQKQTTAIQQYDSPINKRSPLSRVKRACTGYQYHLIPPKYFDAQDRRDNEMCRVRWSYVLFMRQTNIMLRLRVIRLKLETCNKIQFTFNEAASFPEHSNKTFDARRPFQLILQQVTYNK